MNRIFAVGLTPVNVAGHAVVSKVPLDQYWLPPSVYVGDVESLGFL